MSIGYVTFSSGTVEYDDFNSAIAAAQTESGAYLTVTATLDATAYCRGVRTIFEAGSTAAIYGARTDYGAGPSTLELSGGEFLADICGGATIWGDVGGNVSIMIGAGAVIGTSAVPCFVEGIGGHSSGADDVTVSLTGGTLFGSIYGLKKLSTGCTADSVTVSVTGGTVTNDIYGTGAGDAHGAVNVTVTNGAMGGSIYGLGTNGTATGAANVTVSGGTVGGSVYGTGAGTAGGAANVTVSNGAVVDGGVYGVGTNGTAAGAEVAISDVTIKGDVDGVGRGIATSAVTVSISGDTDIRGDVCGVGTNGTAAGAAALSITGGTFEKNVYGVGSGTAQSTVTVSIFGGTTDIRGSIEGVGAGTAGVAHVSVDGVKVGGSVSGVGTNGAATGAAELTISGATIEGDVFGVGSGTAGTLTMTISDDTDIGGSVYGVGTNGVATGAAELKISDATIAGDVYGVGHSTAQDTIAMSISDTCIDGSVYGIGAGDAMGAAELKILYGTIAGDVCGIGHGGAEDTMMLTISKSSVGGSVYGIGTGNDSSVAKDLSVRIDDTTVAGSVFGVGHGQAGKAMTMSIGGDTCIGGSVYGLGDSDTGNALGDVNLRIFDNVLIGGDVYLSGNLNHTGKLTLQMTGGSVTGNIYGAACDDPEGADTDIIDIVGGTFSAGSAIYGSGIFSHPDTYTQNVSVALDSAQTQLERMVGGVLATAGDSITIHGNTEVTLTAGTVTYGVAGRAVVAGTAREVSDGQAGNKSIVNIEGGYSRIVAGGGMLDREETTALWTYCYQYTGDTEINVSGGTIDYLFGGNVARKKLNGNLTEMYGNVAINIDASGSNKIKLKYIYAGSNSTTDHQAIQHGNTCVTFTGKGENLTWAPLSGVGGDGAGKYADIDKTQYERKLVFDDFTGDFAAPEITRFDKILFDNSTVVFTGAKLDLDEVATWEFSLGSTLALNKGVNNFDGDNLIFGAANQSITTDWVAITGYSKTLFGGWGTAHVTVCGDALGDYDEDTLTWSSADSSYVARWDDDNNRIIIALA